MSLSALDERRKKQGNNSGSINSGCYKQASAFFLLLFLHFNFIFRFGERNRPISFLHRQCALKFSPHWQLITSAAVVLLVYIPKKRRTGDHSQTERFVFYLRRLFFFDGNSHLFIIAILK